MTTASAFWRRLDGEGHDAARLVATATGATLEGVAVFGHNGRPACLRYRVHLAADGTTRSGTVAGFVGGADVRIAIARRDGIWYRDGTPVPGLDGVHDLDLGFTPATNLPLLRRLALAVGDARAVDVAWCDLGVPGLVRLPQRYTRTGATAYAYAAPSVGYAATLVLAADGFVRTYPHLWEAVG